MTILQLNQKVRYNTPFTTKNSSGTITTVLYNDPYPYYVQWDNAGDGGWYGATELIPLSDEEYQQIKLAREDRERRHKHAEKYL